MLSSSDLVWSSHPSRNSFGFAIDMKNILAMFSMGTSMQFPYINLLISVMNYVSFQLTGYRNTMGKIVLYS